MLVTVLEAFGIVVGIVSDTPAKLYGRRFSQARVPKPVFCQIFDDVFDRYSARPITFTVSFQRSAVNVSAAIQRSLAATEGES